MRRQYSPKRNSAAWWWGGAIIIVLIISAIRMFAPDAFITLTAPLSRTGSNATASIGSVFASLQSNSSLEEQITLLQQKNAALQNENAALTARTQDLTKLLGNSGVSAGGITAGVLARPPESPYDTLTIGAGSADGVAIGAEVFAQGGVPIGTIKHVYPHSAQVSLFSSPGRTTSGWIGTERTALTLVGAGGGAYSASLPVGASVAAGDSVFVPGPGALPIGTVIKVGSDPSSPTETIYIQPIVNLFSITWVQVAGQ